MMNVINGQNPLAEDVQDDAQRNERPNDASVAHDVPAVANNKWPKGDRDEFNDPRAYISL